MFFAFFQSNKTCGLFAGAPIPRMLHEQQADYRLGSGHENMFFFQIIFIGKRDGLGKTGLDKIVHRLTSRWSRPIQAEATLRLAFLCKHKKRHRIEAERHSLQSRQLCQQC